jgi:GntR family transcriptional regulator
MALDKRNPIPLYYQLAEQLKEQIQSGKLKPGVQLPSERELSEQVGISRMTVRQAIAYLVRDGALVVKQGIGTFVAEPKLAHDTLHLLGFTEDIIRRGGVVMSRVLEQATVIPPASVAIGLNLEPEEMAVKIVRLRLSGEMPLLLETVFIPVALCPGLEYEDMATKSLYALLEQVYGLRLIRARQTLEATTANDYESELFGIEPGTAMILLEGVTYLEQDRPVEYFKAIYRGDRFKFELESHAITLHLSNLQRTVHQPVIGLK